MQWVDLRSDTVTKPSPAMRRAMAEAKVGDDVYGEDPTVNHLEAKVAEVLGKEAGLLLPSGTMSNQTAILAHTERGDEIFIHRDSHAYYYEAGAAAMWAGATFNLLEGEEGYISPAILANALRPANLHHPRSRLVIMENTHNRSGGAAHTEEQMAALFAFSREQGLSVHLDGARLFNAAVALGVPVASLARYADTVSLCLSKGLGAPVGSVLAGPGDFIATARRYRKALGGGMRQAGILAAAGLVALQETPQLLVGDHQRAARMTSALSELGLRAIQPRVPTNMVLVEVGSASRWAAELRTRGVLASAVAPNRLRLVTHRDLSDQDIEEAIAAFKAAAG